MSSQASTSPGIPQTRLSDILPPSEAVQILGVDTTRLIIRNFLRCGCGPSTAPPGSGFGTLGKSSSSGGIAALRGEKTIRYRHPLDSTESSEEQAEIELLLLGISHHFDEGAVSPDVKKRVALAWSKMAFVNAPGYEVDLTADLEETIGGSSSNKTPRGNIGGGISSHSVEEKVPSSPGGRRGLMKGLSDRTGSSSNSHDPRSPEHTNNTTTPYTVEMLFNMSIRRWHAVHGLDKQSFVRRGVLFPPTTVPDRGPNGHMALMDCVFNALCTTPPDPNILMDDAVNAAAALTAAAANSGVSSGDRNSSSSTKNGFTRSSHEDRMAQVVASGRGRPRILLPDLIIAFAICRLAEVDFEYRGFMEKRRSERERKHVEIGQQLMDLENRIGEEETKQQEQVDDNAEEDDTAESVNVSPSKPNLPPRSDGLLLASLLAFRIYDGFQRQNTLTRDTIQRFMSDIHGEESYKAPSAKTCLDKMFLYESDKRDPTPTNDSERTQKQLGNVGPRMLNSIDPNKFQKGVHMTLTYMKRPFSPKSITSERSLIASHILLDWFLSLFNSMLPRRLPPPEKVAEHHLRIVNSDPLRMIDSLCSKYGLYDGEEEGDNVLYEIRRRFRALEQNNAIDNTEESKSKEAREDSGGNESDANDPNYPAPEGKGSAVANVCPDTGVLLAPEEMHEPTVAPRPRNVVDEQSFVTMASKSNDELGHGGYLPAELARWTFRGCAGRIEEVRKAQSGNLWIDGGSDYVEEPTSLPAAREEERYWTIFDALSFGCDAVRWDAIKSTNVDDNVSEDVSEKHAADVPLLRLAFKTFQLLPRQENAAEESSQVDDATLTRSQIGKMLLLLLEHESFRLARDSPPSDASPTLTQQKPWSTKIGNEESLESVHDDDYLLDLTQNNDGSDNILTTLVDASFASILGLLPSKLDLSEFVTDNETSPLHSVPLSILVDYVISESSDTVEQDFASASLDYDGFVRWHLRISSSETDGAMQVSETRLGPYLLDLRLIASVLFGVRPASPSLERALVDEIKRRHRYRYPRKKEGSSQPRGPNGTLWHVINAEWWRTWEHFTEGKVWDDNAAQSYSMGKIDNNMLLSDEGILSLRPSLRWHRDFELVEPLVWSALQAWHDGGPPIVRSVVPYHSNKPTEGTEMSYSPSRGAAKNIEEEYDVELYPLFATVFLCDKVSRGEPRPFQQFV